MINIIGDKKIIVSLLIIALALFLIYFALPPIIGDDSGYYLSIIKEIHNGNCYFTEIAVPYNPLSLFIVSLPHLFLDSVDFRIYLFINILFIIASSVVLYKILNQFCDDKKLKIIFSLLFITINLSLDSGHIMLEPISVFFQILSLYLYFYYRNKNSTLGFLGIGFFIGLSFLAKQYGLFILIPIGIDLIIQKKHFFKKSILIGIGLLFPIIILYSFYIDQVSLNDFITYILGKGGQFDIGSGTGIDYKFRFKPFLRFIYSNSYILLIPIFIILYSKKIKQQDIFILLLPISSFSVLFFGLHTHYFQFLVPYCIIVFVYLLSFNTVKKWQTLLLLLIIGSTLRLGYLSGRNFKHYKNDLNIQKTDLATIQSKIPEQAEVYLSGPSPALYYLANFKSIKLDKISFTFPGYFYPKTIVENMNKGAYLMVNEKESNSYEIFSPLFEKSEVILNGQKYIIYYKK